MKTRKRNISLNNISASNMSYGLLIILFTTVIIYSIAIGMIADYSMAAYLFLLIFGLPIIFIIFYIFKKIYNNWEDIFMRYFVFSFILLTFLILYIITFSKVYLYILGIFSLIFTFTNYIPYLKIKHYQKIQRLKIQREQKAIFKKLVANKNFLNHHNYYNSIDKQSLYKKKILKELIWKSIFRVFCFTTIIFLTGFFSEGARLITVLQVSGIVFFVFSIISVIKDFFVYYWKITRQSTKIYQKSIKSKYFIKVREKIFSY